MSDGLKDFPVDVDRLFDPISAARPAGESLRYEQTYDAVKEYRHADDPALSQGIYEEELDTADWKAVERTCIEALETKTKDLQLAAWLTEAWAHRYHFRGVHGGIRLLAGLVEGFWDDLYPPIKDGSVDVRLGPIQWIDEKLSQELKQLPISRPDVTGDADPTTLLDWETRSTGSASANGNDGPATDVKQSITLTPTPFYRALVDTLDALLDDSRRLERLLADRCEDQTVALTTWKDTLRDVQRVGQRVLSERDSASQAPADDAPADEETPAWMPEESDEPTDTSVQIQSRADAYRVLWEAAEYLMRTEPHSPTPYLVKRAVSWGNMSLNELLQELMHSTDDLESIYELLGMDAPPDDSAS